MSKLELPDVIDILRGCHHSVWSLKKPLRWNCWMTPNKPVCLTVVYDGCHSTTGVRLHVVEEGIEPCMINNALVVSKAMFQGLANQFNISLTEEPQ